MNSVIPSNTVSLQVAEENNRDNQIFKVILSKQQAPPPHVNFAGHFF